jgi:M6 family metalloprotease-like protein
MKGEPIKAMKTSTVTSILTIIIISFSIVAGAQSPTMSLPPASPTPTPSPADQIKAKYAQMGGSTGVLGAAKSSISRATDGAYYQHYQNGSIYWSQATGVHETHGEIWKKYNGLGGPSSLGYPVTDELTGPNGGRYSSFKKGSVTGSIYCKSVVGAHLVSGAIRDKYLGLGGPAKLGYPTTDEASPAKDTAVRFNHFENGWSIYWKKSVGAYEVHGAIRLKYLSLGGPDSFLGVPITNESVTPDTIGRYNHFEGGSIYWTPQTGAHEVHGWIREKWAGLGWERSWLGYPLTDEIAAPGYTAYGLFNQFQGGRIYYSGGGTFAVPDLARDIPSAVTGPDPDRRWHKLDQSIRRQKVLTIIWYFDNPGNPVLNPTVEEIRKALFGYTTNAPPPYPGSVSSVKDWYRENSSEKLILEDAGILGPYKSAKPGRHYLDNQDLGDGRTDNDADDYHHQKYNDGWKGGHSEKWAEAILRAAQDFDFEAYDKNLDGKLTPDELAVLIVISSADQSGFARPVVGRQLPYEYPLKLGGVDGLQFTWIAEWYANSPTVRPLNLGLPAHELSHLIMGTPDIYFSGVPESYYKGFWPYAAENFSIMDVTWSTTHFDPFMKLKSGWLSYDVAIGSGSYDYTLKDVETSGKVLILYDPIRSPREYFIVEYRFRGSSYDAGRNSIGAGHGLSNDGIAIWHIIEDPALYQTVQLPPKHDGGWGRQGIRLIRADGGVPSGYSVELVGGIPIPIPLPPNDDHALFANQFDFVSDTGASRGGNASPVRPRWFDGSETGFEVKLLSQPGLKSSSGKGSEVRLAIRISSVIQ